MSMTAELYRRLPAPVQSLAASARGYQLQSRRYGPETEILVSEALERDSWDAARWKPWQEDRLARTLHHAATRVPYYREQWARRRRDGDRSSWEVLANWPILSKQTLRDDPRSFLAEGSERGIRNARRAARPALRSGSGNRARPSWTGTPSSRPGSDAGTA